MALPDGHFTEGNEMNEYMDWLETQIREAECMGATGAVSDILQEVRRRLPPEFHLLSDLPSLSTSQVAIIEGVSPQTIAERCRDSEYPGASKTDGSHGNWQIPIEAIAKRRSSAPKLRQGQAEKGFLGDIPRYSPGSSSAA
jgi:hypothetical protein